MPATRWTSVKYYNDVIKTMVGEDKTKDFFWLFMVPDCGMCPGLKKEKHEEQ